MLNADEDTYVYVNVITASISTGLCVSRYDVFLYSHAMATLSYQPAPKLVDVSLLHKGGLGGGTPAGVAIAGANRHTRSILKHLNILSSPVPASTYGRPL